jgi:hypothetical protein
VPGSSSSGRLVPSSAAWVRAEWRSRCSVHPVRARNSSAARRSDSRARPLAGSRSSTSKASSSLARAAVSYSSRHGVRSAAGDPGGQTAVRAGRGSGPGCGRPGRGDVQGRWSGRRRASLGGATSQPRHARCQLPVPGGRRRRGVPAAKPSGHPRAGWLANRGCRAELGDQAGEPGPVDPPGGASEVVVQEGVDGVLERTVLPESRTTSPTSAPLLGIAANAGSWSMSPSCDSPGRNVVDERSLQQIGALLRQTPRSVDS